MNTNNATEMELSSKVELSIISPVYRGADILEELCRQIEAAISNVVSSYEIILVDDGSPDGAWNKISELARRDPRIKGVRLARNFGQHFAITAGIDHACGKYTVLIDCDLQENPQDIPRLLAAAKDGADVVYAERKQREQGPLKTWAANCYYQIYNFLTESKRSNPRRANLSLLSERAREAYRRFRDTQRHYLLIVDWLGYPSTTIEIEHHPRHSGRSAYTFWKLLNHAIDGIVSQSTRLLRLSVVVGLFLSLGSIIGSAWLVIAYFVHGFKEGWASLAVLILLCTGSVLLSVGVASLYIGKIFEQVKGRPLYLVQDRANFRSLPSSAVSRENA